MSSQLSPRQFSLATDVDRSDLPWLTHLANTEQPGEFYKGAHGLAVYTPPISIYNGFRGHLQLTWNGTVYDSTVAEDMQEIKAIYGKSATKTITALTHKVAAHIARDYVQSDVVTLEQLHVAVNRALFSSHGDAKPHIPERLVYEVATRLDPDMDPMSIYPVTSTHVIDSFISSNFGDNSILSIIAAMADKYVMARSCLEETIFEAAATVRTYKGRPINLQELAAEEKTAITSLAESKITSPSFVDEQLESLAAKVSNRRKLAYLKAKDEDDIKDIVASMARLEVDPQLVAHAMGSSEDYVVSYYSKALKDVQ